MDVKKIGELFTAPTNVGALIEVLNGMDRECPVHMACSATAGIMISWQMLGDKKVLVFG